MIYGIIFEDKFFSSKDNLNLINRYLRGIIEEGSEIWLLQDDGWIYTVPSISLCTFITDKNKLEHAEFLI